MQGSHFLDKIQPQTGTFATLVRARQGIESLGQTRQGKTRNCIALIENLHQQPFALALYRQADQTVGDAKSIVWSSRFVSVKAFGLEREDQGIGDHRRLAGMDGAQRSAQSTKGTNIRVRRM